MRESSKLNSSLARTLLCDSFKFFRGSSAKTAISFVQISIELFETWLVNQGMYFSLITLDCNGSSPFARPLRWKNVEIDLLSI